MSYKSSIRYTKNEPSAKSVYLEVHYDGDPTFRLHHTL